MPPRRPASTPGALQEPLPVQPVANPIICNPYDEPAHHWVYDTATGEARQEGGRRPASYWFQTQRAGESRDVQLPGFAEEQRDDLPLVNRLRADVRRWRESGYRHATPITRELLKTWNDPERAHRSRRLFFCQREAAETVIYLAELRAAGRGPGFNPQFTEDDLAQLVDTPADDTLGPLVRYGCKMATGSGKTVVMAMLIAWALCNRGRVPSDARFPAGVLVVCPNLTVKERLQVLLPSHRDNYYAAFDLVPTGLRPLLQQGRVLVTNWHLFAPESEHVEGGRSYVVVDKGPESDEAFARRVLGDLYDAGPLMVLNDEGHHAYRPAPLPGEAADGDGAGAVASEALPDAAPLARSRRRRGQAVDLTGEEARAASAAREEATIWVSGLDRINAARGIRFCVDLSATPFYIAGSGYPIGSPFPWLVSDFGLVDAIESGIVKIPRLPVNDASGRPEPKYFRLWRWIDDRLGSAERLPGRARKPKPEAVFREAQDALNTLASQWKERFELIQAASDVQEKAPPVLIVVCDNTDIAEVFYREISGERTVEVVDPDAADEDDAADDEEAAPTPGRRSKARTRTVYGNSAVFPEFSNTPARRYTLRIDSKLLAEAESESPNATRQQAAQELRRIVATIGRRGEPGEHIRCVVSVGMLTEGWDANNVTHILGVRAFGSQLLCEQVVGRGLRRMDYTPDPKTGLLTEEYVDVYGIPFSLIPFKGRKTDAPAPEDRPKNHVRALPERAGFEIRFPVVEGYAFALRHDSIRADVDGMEPLLLDPVNMPPAVFVRPTVGYQQGALTGHGPGEWVPQDRAEYYASTHLQAIQFEIARRIVTALVGEGVDAAGARGNPKLRLQSRHRLFPQVLRLVLDYTAKKVDFRGMHPCELGHRQYVGLMVERLIAQIEPDDAEGEPPLLPILNRYKPIGTTAEVDFKTTRPVAATERSHVNSVVLDTHAWEQSAAFRLELARDAVAWYARNDQAGLVIPYEYHGVSHGYEPDYLVKLTNDVTLVLEIKGNQHQDVVKAKSAAARRWVSAVNNWGRLGRWDYHLNADPQLLGQELRSLAHQGT